MQAGFSLSMPPAGAEPCGRFCEEGVPSLSSATRTKLSKDRRYALLSVAIFWRGSRALPLPYAAFSPMDRAIRASDSECLCLTKQKTGSACDGVRREGNPDRSESPLTEACTQFV